MYYYIGRGVEEDDMKAVRLVTVSAKLQSTDACAQCKCWGIILREVKEAWSSRCVRSVYYMKPAIEEYLVMNCVQTL